MSNSYVSALIYMAWITTLINLPYGLYLFQQPRPTNTSMSKENFTATCTLDNVSGSARSPYSDKSFIVTQRAYNFYPLVAEMCVDFLKG